MHMLELNGGTDHVSAQDQACENMSMFGDDVYIAKYGGGLSLTMTTSNQLTVGAGAIMVNGRHCIIDPAETLEVVNGSTGMTRRDLLCVHWQAKSGTGVNQVESAELAIVKGTPAASGAVDPTIANKVIKAGVTEAYVPIARITVVDLTPTVSLLVPKLASLSELGDSLSQATTKQSATPANGMTCELVGSMVTVTLLNITLKANTWRTIGTLPAAYRPSADHFGVVFTLSNMGYFKVTPEGVVSAASAVAGNYTGSSSFPAK